MYLILAALLVVPAPEKKDEKIVQPTNVLNSWTFTTSVYKDKGSITIRDDKAWEREWKKTKSTEPIPKVDFEANMIVGYYWGSQPTSGYTTQITKVRRGLGTTWVTVTRKKPKPGDVTANNITSPATFAIVPKSNKVVFIFRH